MKGKPRGYAFVEYENKDVRSVYLVLPSISNCSPRVALSLVHTLYHTLIDAIDHKKSPGEGYR